VSTPSEASGAAASGHVLVAGGDADSLERRESQLRAAGYRVSLARTGFEAIVKASCHVPDLILIDDSIADIEAAETGRLITTCPVTAHIPIVRLGAGRRVPPRVFTRLRRRFG
jgi:CheY-like chemotaxis protein